MPRSFLDSVAVISGRARPSRSRARRRRLSFMGWIEGARRSSLLIRLLRKLLIFDRHFEIAFLQVLRADSGHPATLLGPFAMRLPLQYLHIPMKRCRHWLPHAGVWS